MIKTLIFDFGDVFINLDKEGAMKNALKLFNLDAFDEDMIITNQRYETGHLSTTKFLEFYKNKFNYLSEEVIVNAWNAIIKDFPLNRLEFIKQLRSDNRFTLILLSNTNELHIDFIKRNIPFYRDFKNCFDAFYLSHEIHLRKPEKDIFEFVLKTHNLKTKECLFIDDTKENTDTADLLGLKTWNIDETKEDIVDLFEIKKNLF